MSDYDMMKLFSQFDGEVSESDFTPEPLSIAEWKRAYFEKYDDVKDKSLKKQDW